MLKNNVSESHLKQFDNDTYKPGYAHLDIPSFIYSIIENN